MLRTVAACLFVWCLLVSSAQAVDLSGCWKGTWESACSGHHGPLNAHFVKCNDQQYRVTFSGRFFKIMPFRYSVTLHAVHEGDKVKLTGESFLGRLMGTFTYDADATATRFRASYSSCKDNGWFCLDKCCVSTCDQ